MIYDRLDQLSNDELVSLKKRIHDKLIERNRDAYLTIEANLARQDWEDDPRSYEPEDHFRDDVEADADVLRMAGMGTDEDYGFYGEDFLD